MVFYELLTEGSRLMYFNNRNNSRYYGYGCSFFSLMIGMMVLSLIIRGSLIFFFRYFWLILALGAVVWIFRKFIHKDENTPNDSGSGHSGHHNDWGRDFENRKNTSYHNFDREFEEVDEDDDEFEDF